MKPYKKAYKVSLEKIEDGYLYSEQIVFAETRGKAKLLFGFDKYVLANGDECTLLNIPIRRSKDDDIYLVDGIEKSKRMVDYDLEKQKRKAKFDQLLKHNPNGKAYIMKGEIYWRPNSRGYTDHQRFAGVYDLKEAVDICKSSDIGRFERPVLIDKKEHNENINKMIKDLKTRLIA